MARSWSWCSEMTEQHDDAATLAQGTTARPRATRAELEAMTVAERTAYVNERSDAYAARHIEQAEANHEAALALLDELTDPNRGDVPNSAESSEYPSACLWCGELASIGHMADCPWPRARVLAAHPVAK